MVGILVVCHGASIFRVKPHCFRRWIFDEITLSLDPFRWWTSLHFGMLLQDWRFLSRVIVVDTMNSLRTGYGGPTVCDELDGGIGGHVCIVDVFE